MSASTRTRIPRSTNLRRVLVASTVVGALAVAAFWAGSAWLPGLVHLAVVAAVVAGALAVWASLADFAAYRRRAAAEHARTLEEHRTQIRTVHQTQREVLTAIDARTRTLRSTLSRTRLELGEAQQTVSRLRGDNEALRLDNESLRVENADLRGQLQAATRGEGEADVFALPRRRAAGGDEFDALEAPTVVDLDLQRLASPFVEDVLRRRAN